MSKFSLASRATRELIALIKRGKQQDDVANYPAIKELIEGNKYFPKLMESLTDPSGFQPISAEQRESGRRNIVAELSKRKQLKRRRRIIDVAASLAGGIILAGTVMYFAGSENSQQQIISYNVPVEKHSVPVVVLSNGEHVDLAASGRIADGQSSIDNLEDRLVYESSAYMRSVDPSQRNKILTPEKCRYSVVLSDGSEIILNANSEIEYPISFGANERRVTLRGEAFFKVSKDSRPFIVNCAGVDIEVYGTEFNVNSHNKEQVMAVLVSGSIGVHVDLGPTMIKPNQAAVVSLRNRACRVLNVDTSLYTGWMKDVFAYDGAPFEMLLNDMASWYGVEFHYDRRIVDDIDITVNLNRAQDVEKIMNSLSTLLNINFIRKEDNIYDISPM